MDKQKLYDLRWLLKNKWGSQEHAADAIKIVSDLIGDSPQEPVIINNSVPTGPANTKSLWCPFADANFPKSTVRGDYRKGYPEGAIVHFTAGRWEGLQNGLLYQANQGYTYFLIDKEGNIGQNFPLNKWGYHAGESSWTGLGTGVSKYLVGIEVQCAGVLDQHGKSWFGQTFPKAETRQVPKMHNIAAGNYLKFTDKQEAALVKLLLWLKRNNPDVFDIRKVLGHDEVSPGRKTDPGGSLSMSMPSFRELLISEHNKGN